MFNLIILSALLTIIIVLLVKTFEIVMMLMKMIDEEYDTKKELLLDLIPLYMFIKYLKGIEIFTNIKRILKYLKKLK